MIQRNKQHIDRKLVLRLRFLFAVFMFMAIIISYDVVVGAIRFLLALSGVLIGIGLGFLAGRMMRIRWHEKKNKISTEMDKQGVIILVAYLIFVFFRDRLLGHWLDGAVLTAFGFSLLTGILFGRYLNMKLEIERVLKEKNYW
ncbi:hypothetical protein HYT55_02380 [Candidatus Woesearchaeota archaeon]|nr:hypothetical protein [Candidatus Woesearchaeota archaeon]